MSDCGAHCWHLYTGAIHMVVPDGHVVVKCCKCPSITTQHRDHVNHLDRRVPRWEIITHRHFVAG